MANLLHFESSKCKIVSRVVWNKQLFGLWRASADRTISRSDRPINRPKYINVRMKYLLISVLIRRNYVSVYMYLSTTCKTKPRNARKTIYFSYLTSRQLQLNPTNKDASVASLQTYFTYMCLNVFMVCVHAYGNF